MSLIPWRNKRREIQSSVTDPAPWPFQREMERFFDRFMQGWPGWGEDLWPTARPGAWLPAMDVTEDERGLVIRAELPGIDPKDVKVSVTNRTVTIEGEKEESTEKKKGSSYFSERRFGRFRRNFELPPSVDPDKVQAEHAHGVLTLRFERNPKAAVKRIPVTTR
mgnify:CR=1 FL=1